MSDWDAQLYRQFEAERTRPAADLLAQVDLTAPGLIADLGCGPGNSTELLARRFPHATIIGVDTSTDMLASARERLPSRRFEQADIATWQPPAAPDLLFANASLQWVRDHPSLLPRLFGLLAPGGVLAVQMPDNREEPSHRAMRAVAAEAPWSAFAGPAGGRAAILPPTSYYDLLSPLAGSVDLWRTTYHHPMPSAAAIVTWVRSTGLRPFLDPVPADLRDSFLARYQDLIEAAYPVRSDGQRLLAFPRLFIVARRASVV